MASGTLTINLDAVAANWRALDALSAATVETAAVVKADAYGLGIDRTARALAKAGATSFFVALAEEGDAVRKAIGDGPRIFVFSGHMSGDTTILSQSALVPLLNSPEQVRRHMEACPELAFGVQLNTGMNRLGMQEADWRSLAASLLARKPALLMSHLACADEPDHPMNAVQLAAFRRMTEGTGVARSLAATGGLLLGPDYHFDLTRPGIGLYGGQPFVDAFPVVTLSLPVVQIRDVAIGETVGYGNTWIAKRPTRVATLSGGYADGLIRAMTGRASVFSGATPCPLIGRVSMDLMGVDVTDLADPPESLDILNATQTVDVLAGAAGTIGYEILTSLGPRYTRIHSGASECS